MTSSIATMTLGDMLDRTVRVIGKTFWRNVALAVTFLIIPILLLATSANRFYSSLPDFAAQVPVRNPEAFGPILLGSFYFGSAYTIFIAAALLAEIAVSLVVAGELNAQTIGYGAAMKMTFSRRWINGIGEGILKVLIFIGVGFFISILVAIMAAAAGNAAHRSGAILTIFTVLFIVVLAGGIIYLVLRLYFALTAVAVEDLGPINAFKKSWLLVGGHWWRTLGILIVFLLLSGFAISIISVPIMFGSMWKEYREMFTVIGQTHGNISPENLQTFQRGMGHMIGVGSGVSSFLSLLITPAFTVVMYFDLRARHNDLPEAKAENDSQDVPLVSL